MTCSKGWTRTREGWTVWWDSLFYSSVGWMLSLQQLFFLLKLKRETRKTKKKMKPVRLFGADSVISGSDQRSSTEAAQLLLLCASETAEWHVRAIPPEDTRQLLLVAETSGRPTEDLSRSPLGDGWAGGVIVIFRGKVWRELDLTLKNGVLESGFRAAGEYFSIRKSSDQTGNGIWLALKF